jgi:hypothetical protein
MAEIGIPAGEPPRPPSSLFDDTESAAYKADLTTRIYDYQVCTLLSSHSKLIEAELWAYGHVWKSDVLNYGTMWEGPNYTRARPLGS